MSEVTAQTIDPSRPLSPAEVRRALTTSMIAWGLFGSASMSIVGGAAYVTFVRDKLHASTFLYVVIMSVPYAASLAQLYGSYLTETVRRRRRQCLAMTSIARSVWFLIAALPWIVPEHPHALRLGLLLGLMLLSSVLSHISNPAGFSWFADVMPARIRARYLANRAAVSTTTMVIASTTVSWIIDHHQSFLTFSLVFLIGGVLGQADIWFYCLRVREPRMAPHEGPRWGVFAPVVVPWRNRTFRRYLLYAFSEAFMNALVGPLWWLMALEFLKIGAFWANMYVMVVPMVASALALPFWGKVANRLPARRLVYIGTFAGLIYPALWVLATPRLFHPFLLISALIGGSCWAATQTADMSMMYSLTPRVNRSAFMACLMLAGNFGIVLAQITGGRIAQALEPLHLHVGGLIFGNIHLLMLLSIVVILAHAAFVIPRLPSRVEEPAPVPALASTPDHEPASD